MLSSGPRSEDGSRVVPLASTLHVPTWRKALRGPLGAALLGAAVIVIAVVLLRPMTPRITFNQGLGYDGQHYAAMVGAMRGDPTPVLAERPHYAYRPLPMAIVAASGLDVIRGFLWMNVLSLVGAGALLGLLLRSYGAPLLLVGVGVLWWAVLPGNVRYALFNPVLVDGIGLLLLMAATVAAALRRPVMFAAVLIPGVLARENLVVVVPMLWLALLPQGFKRATAWTVAASIPALIAMYTVRQFPPVPVAASFDAFFEIRQNVDWFLGNAAERFWRFLAAWPMALGILPFVPLAAPRRVLGFLREHPEWAYALVSAVPLIIVIGGDYDRYFLFLAPVLVLLTCVTLFRGRVAIGVLALLTAVHLLAVRAAAPVSNDEVGYLRYNVTTMDLALLREQLVRSLVAVLGGTLALIIATHLRSRSNSGLTTPRAGAGNI